MSSSVYDKIADWYDDLRRDGAISIVDNLMYPIIISLLKDNSSTYVCDLGCGQGKLSRAIAERGVRVLGVDTSRRLIEIARRYEDGNSKMIEYVEDDAQTLSSIGDSQFDAVICNMALMDICDLRATFHSVFRVLKTSGWFAATISHPCFDSPHSEWGSSTDGKPVRRISKYYREGYWRPQEPNGLRGRVGAHHRMISSYVNCLLEAGFSVVGLFEPKIGVEDAKWVPGLAVVPTFMMIQEDGDASLLTGPNCGLVEPCGGSMDNALSGCSRLLETGTTTSRDSHRKL